MKAIYFDMDGTIADFYSVNGWLDCLLNNDIRPYLMAKPMFDVWAFAKLLNSLKRKGYHIGIISWSSKNASKEFNERIEKAKKHWLKENLLITLDEIKVVPYGTPKSKVVDFPNGILFDDEEKNRIEWGMSAYAPAEMIKILKSL